jgi:hypothetical protein
LQPGRAKGSKNKINVLKLALEQAALEDNGEAIREVITGIIKDAKKGDSKCRKLVWDAVMSKGLADAVKATEKVEIRVGLFKDPEKEITADVTIVDGDFTEEESDEQPEPVQ